LSGNEVGVESLLVLVVYWNYMLYSFILQSKLPFFHHQFLVVRYFLTVLVGGCVKKRRRLKVKMSECLRSTAKRLLQWKLINEFITKLKKKAISGFIPEVVTINDVENLLEDYVMIPKEKLKEYLEVFGG